MISPLMINTSANLKISGLEDNQNAIPIIMPVTAFEMIMRAIFSNRLTAIYGEYREVKQECQPKTLGKIDLAERR
jgi:hypothetical protein